MSQSWWIKGRGHLGSRKLYLAINISPLLEPTGSSVLDSLHVHHVPLYPFSEL